MIKNCTFACALICTMATAEPLPETDGAANKVSQTMTGLVADNFYGFVVDKDTQKVIGEKAWFIDFFSPWCSHCRQFAPTWDEFYKIH